MKLAYQTNKNIVLKNKIVNDSQIATNKKLEPKVSKIQNDILNQKFISENLKFFRPPAESAHRGFTVSEMHHPLECLHCLPACIESYYVDDEDITSDTQPRAQNSYGYLDLYYRSGGAVYYERDVTFGRQDLLGMYTNIFFVCLTRRIISVAQDYLTF